MPKAKAASWLSIKSWLEKHEGQGALDNLQNAVSPEAKAELFTRPILTSSWIDFSLVVQTMLTARRIFGNDQDEWLDLCGRELAQHDFRGIYKVFISFTSPRFIMENAARVWRQMFDQGDASVETEGKAIRLIVNNFDAPLHHEKLQMPYQAEIIRMSGAKNVRYRHVKCKARGDEHCLTEATWD